MSQTILKKQISKKLRAEIEKILLSIDNIDVSIHDLKPLTDMQFLQFSVKKLSQNNNWSHVSFYFKLSEEFLETFANYLNWRRVGASKKMSEEFILKFKDYIRWEFLPRTQVLSEKFMNEYADKIDWRHVAKNQHNLSIEFIKNHFEKFVVLDLLEHQVLDDELILKCFSLPDDIGQIFHHILKHQVINEEIFEEKRLLFYRRIESFLSNQVSDREFLIKNRNRFLECLR